MKFYNPFKPHVWQSPDTGYWYVRKWDFGWEYLDKEIPHDWWTISKYVRKHASFKSELEAMTRLAYHIDSETV